MGTGPAVTVTGVGKRFRIRHRGPAGLKDRALGWVRGHSGDSEEFWALRDVSLAIAAGEMVGVIGANGSGKSTLLQVIAGIHEPETGSVAVSGRLTSLLELGTGFNPELSGRDNVFLNGSLLGFSRSDIRARFDRIVGFAELERFIDMPLKTYSSGMQLRLGFATAAHFDPEVLLLDEVLAVGDDLFQRRCLSRVRDIRESGAAILFISHDLVVVEQMCNRVAAIDDGRLVDEGEPPGVVSRYRAALAHRSLGAGQATRWGSGEARFTRVVLEDGAGVAGREFETGAPLTVRLEYEAGRPIAAPVFGLAVRRDDGTLVTGPNTKMSGCRLDTIDGAGAIEFAIPRLPLLPGAYRLAVSIYDAELVNPYDHWEQCAEFVVAGTTTLERFGLVSFDAEWRVAR